MRTRRCAGLAALLVLLCAVSLHAQSWEAELRPDKPLAELRPRVMAFADGGANVEVRDGLIVFNSPTPESGAWIGIGRTPPMPGTDATALGDASAWNGRRPTTVEARLRVVSACTKAGIVAQMQVSDGRNAWILNVRPKGIADYPFDATEFHTYRITARDGIANLYVDEKLLPDNCLILMKYPRNALLIGDLSKSTGGVSEWQYIRWTNKEATPWQASEEAMKRIEDERVVVGDRPDDVEEANALPPFGAPAALPDGRLMLWYVVGKGIPNTAQIEDPSIPQKAFARFSEDNGRTWSDSRLLFEFPREKGARTDGVILVSRTGTIHLFGLNFFGYDLKPPFPMEHFHSDLWHARSTDGGKTWSAPQNVDFGYAYTGATNSVIQLRSGRILVPISRYSPRPTGRFISCVPYSDDDGKTWRRPVDEVVVDTGGGGLESGACEPVATELKDGRVWMLIRAQDGYEWETFSSDEGLHWEPPRHSRFVSTNSPVATLRLRDGRILLIWNNCDGAALPGVRASRLLMAAAVSADEGKTWMGYREIARSAVSGILAYPFAAQAPDGKVMVFLWAGNRMLRLDPDFLTRTTFREDFAEGLARWSRLGSEGVEAVADPDGGKGRVLRLRKPNEKAPAGASLNFPFGAKGEIKMNLRIEPGFQGAQLALSDHFTLPGIAKDGCFNFKITAEDLKPGVWQDVTIAWDCVGKEAAISVDDKNAPRVAAMGAAPGVCYLRLRLLAPKTDDGGLFVRSVEARAAP